MTADEIKEKRQALSNARKVVAEMLRGNPMAQMDVFILVTLEIRRMIDDPQKEKIAGVAQFIISQREIELDQAEEIKRIIEEN